MSRVLKQAPSQYGRAFLLTETDEADVTYFLLHQLDVLKVAISDLDVYLAKKAKQLRSTDALLRGDVTLNHRQRAVIADALRHPHARHTIEAHRRQQGVVYETARTDLLAQAEKRRGARDSEVAGARPPNQLAETARGTLSN